MPLTPTPSPAAPSTLAADITVNRVGYGAMQLAGPSVFGPPADRDEAIRVLREAVELGIDHIDTSDFYGPHVTNEIIKEALHPYPENLTIVTKVGRETRRRRRLAARPLAARAARSRPRQPRAPRPRGDSTSSTSASAASRARKRARSPSSSKRSPRCSEEGLIRHLGVSTFSAEQIAEARSIAPIVCVQNMYNLANRGDDELIDSLAADGIAYVPYFPLGGFSPLQARGARTRSPSATGRRRWRWRWPGSCSARRTSC